MGLRYLGEKDLLFFMHIMKTAGTSINVKILDYIERRKTTYYTKYVGLQKIKKVSDRKLNSFSYLTGHYDWSPLARIKKNVIAFTVLRDPVQRTISLYKQFKRSHKNKDLQDGEIYNFFLSENNSFKDFVLNDYIRLKRITNMQTRTIASTEEKSYKDVMDFEILSSEEMLDAALKHAEKFAFIGLVERMDDTMLLLSNFCGFKPIGKIKTINASDDSQIALDKETQKILEAHLALDIKLYRYAQDRMNSQLKSITYEKVMKNYVGVMHEVRKITSFGKIKKNQIAFVKGWYPPWLFGKAHWTGPETESEIDFSIEGFNKLLCEFRIINYLDLDILKSLQIKVNDIKVDYKYSFRRGGKCSFEISRDILEKNPKLTTVKLCLNRTVSAKELNISDEDRKLGIQICNFGLKAAK